MVSRIFIWICTRRFRLVGVFAPLIFLVPDDRSLVAKRAEWCQGCEISVDPMVVVCGQGLQ
ncbi:hypothetical protein D3C86_1868360 [compost metagenome]